MQRSWPKSFENWNDRFGIHRIGSYDCRMETSREIDVVSLDVAAPPALEGVLGTPLHSNQRRDHQCDAGQCRAEHRKRGPAQRIEDWTNVYEGLSDQEIQVIDEIVKTGRHLVSR